MSILCAQAVNCKNSFKLPHRGHTRIEDEAGFEHQIGVGRKGMGEEAVEHQRLWLAVEIDAPAASSSRRPSANRLTLCCRFVAALLLPDVLLSLSVSASGASRSPVTAPT
jgi:hypothetical protein